MQNLYTKLEKNLLKIQDSRKVLNLLNTILTNEKLENRDKILLSNITLEMVTHSRMSFVEEIKKFISDPDLIKRSVFSCLVENINTYLEKDIYEEDNYASNKKRKKVDIDRKYNCVLLFATNNKQIEDIELLKITSKILESKLDWQNYRCLIDVFQNDILKHYQNKAKIIMNILLNEKIEADYITVINGGNINGTVWNVLTHPDALKMSDKIYEQLAYLAVRQYYAVILEKLLNQSELNLYKKSLAVEYYRKLFSEQLLSYSKIHMEGIEEISRLSICELPYCKNLLKVSDEEYKKVLDKVYFSNKPQPLATIVIDEHLNDDRKSFAIKLINQGLAEEYKWYTVAKKDGYYKHEVAEVATAFSLKNLSFDEYKEFLIKYNQLVELRDDVRCDDQTKIQQLNSLVNNTDLFLNEPIKLRIAIKEMLNLKNLDAIEDISEFCNHINSLYYTDTEYRKIIQLIKNNECREYEKQRLLIQLFTNDMLPYLNDKTVLFVDASFITSNISDSAFEWMRDKVNRLNAEGKKRNVYEVIFNGVSKEVKKQAKQEIKSKYLKK